MESTKLRYNIILPALFAMYIYAVFKVILFKFDTIDLPFLWHQLQRNMGTPIFIKSRLQSGNFMPFESISQNMQVMSHHDLINLVGNIAIFLPYGVFLLLLSPHKRMSATGVFFRAVGLSLGLECSQVVFTIGNFDVDDLILNGLGGLIGWGLMLCYTKFAVNKQELRGDVIPNPLRSMKNIHG